MKRVLFITTRLFWPADSGRKVSLYYYCKGLSEYCGFEVHLYSFLENGQKTDDIDDHPDFISSVTPASPVCKATKVLNLMSKSLMQGWPLQCSLYYSRKNVRRIKALCDKLEPDIIITDMIRLAPYIKAFAKRKCLKISDLDDMLSLRYSRQAENADSGSNITGNYAMSAAGDRLLGSSRIKRMILRSESKRVRKAEIKYANIYDKTIFVSDKETEKLNRLCGFDKAYTVRLGVDYDYYAEPLDIDTERGTLAFLGNMNVSANADSLAFIIKNILPKLNFDYKFHIVGTVPDALMQKYARSNIVFHGRVDDVRKIIRRCKLFLSPIVYGTGIKTKILEAMAMGVPVITNSIGAEGIDGEKGVHFEVHDDADGLADAVNKMIGADNSAMSRAARDLIYDKYMWSKIYADLDSVVNGVCR